MRNRFPKKEQNDIIQCDYLDVLYDSIINIVDEHSLWSTLLFDPDIPGNAKGSGSFM